MSSAATKIISLGFAAALILTSCGPSAEEQAASELLGQTQALIDMGQYGSAIDSVKVLNERFRSLTAIRRMALRLQAVATEGLIKDSIQAIEPVLAQSTLDCDSLASLFDSIPPAAEGLEGYYLPKGVKATGAVSQTGIQPRVSLDGYLYLAANINGRLIGLQTLSLSDAGKSWTSGVISPARVVTVEGSEIASIAPEEIQGLGEWLMENPGGAIKGSFNGDRGKVAFAVSPELRRRIILCWRYSEGLQLRRHAAIQREKLERKLQSVRDQLANMPLPAQD